METYWHKDGSIFHCSMVSNVMNWSQFKDLRCCMHLTNPEEFTHVVRGDPAYDKMHQIRWLVNDIRDACKHEWKLGKHLTIDEMMVRYKGSIFVLPLLYLRLINFVLLSFITFTTFGFL